MKGLTDIAGLRVGHASDFEALTGCTVILCPAEGTVAAVDVRGSAVGEREVETLRPGHLVERIHAVVLAGGSAFGLDAAAGVMRYLEEQGIGFDAGVVRVPIVPAAILFDLGIGNPQRRPDAAMGYEAAQRATADAVEGGSVGAGTGATVGKLFGIKRATKGGVGTMTIELAGGVQVSALAVVNAFGDVRDPRNGTILAGARTADDAAEFADTVAQMKRGLARQTFGLPAVPTSTTLAVVATDGRFDRLGLAKVAAMAQNGVARAIAPAHTLFDGDIVFALSVGEKPADVNTVGETAAEAVAAAIVRGVEQARSLGGVPALGDLRSGK
ncbi:MAG: P1 family peptidase [Acidobacteria bacterium]|nr:P1 family peptidase [Acidobacteriota bacterium]